MFYFNEASIDASLTRRLIECYEINSSTHPGGSYTFWEIVVQDTQRVAPLFYILGNSYVPIGLIFSISLSFKLSENLEEEQKIH